MDKIHIIARAYIRDGDFILLAEAGTHLFLPGGHINYEEPAHVALLRELREEMWVDHLQIGKFLGVVENIWDNKGKAFHEHCIIFQVESNEFSSNKLIRPKEEHLKFRWIKFDESKNFRFLPYDMYDFLMAYEVSKEVRFLSVNQFNS